MTNNTYLQSIQKGESGLYLLLTLLSMSMLITGMDTAYASPLLVLLSLPMLRRPVTLVPMLFISSWNMTFALYGLGAYFYYFILFVIAVCFHHRQYGRYVGPKSTTLLCLLFGVYVVYGAFHSLSHETGSSVRLMFTIFSVAYASLFRCHDRHYIYSTLFSIAITASIYFGLLMLISPAQYIREDVVQEMVKVSSRPTIMRDVNPNQAGQIVAILSVILFVTATRLGRFKAWIVFALLLNLSTLISVASRTSFYALGICFALYLFLAAHISRGRKILLMLLTAAGMYFLLHFIDSIESRLLVSSALEDNGSGRFISWAHLWEEVVPVYWLQGIGYGRENYSSLGYSYDADNMYMDLLCQLGIIGSAIFYLLHFWLMRCVNAARKASAGMEFLFFMLLCYLIFGLGESVFDSPHYWATLFLASTLLPEHPTKSPKRKNTAP